MTWQKHKPRVWRQYRARTRATVAPSLERREWIWTIDRINGQGHTSERCRGRCRRARDARRLAAIMLDHYECLEREAAERRYAPYGTATPESS